MKQGEFHLGIIRTGSQCPASNGGEERSVARLIAEGELEAWVDTERAAAFFSVSRSTLDHYRCQGRGPAYTELGACSGSRSKGCIRYRVGDLWEYSKEHCVRSTGEARYRRASRVSQEPSETPAQHNASKRLLNIQQPASDADRRKAARRTQTARGAPHAS